VPLDWDELGEGIKSDHFTPADVVRRVSKLRRDPWHEMAGLRQTLTRSAHKLLGL
jgi:bifunctional non-homologous end joining protein LigD